MIIHEIVISERILNLTEMGISYLVHVLNHNHHPCSWLWPSTLMCSTSSLAKLTFRLHCWQLNMPQKCFFFLLGQKHCDILKCVQGRHGYNSFFSELSLKKHRSFCNRLNQCRSFYYKKIIFYQLLLKKTTHFEHDL